MFPKTKTYLVKKDMQSLNFNPKTIFRPMYFLLKSQSPPNKVFKILKLSIGFIDLSSEISSLPWNHSILVFIFTSKNGNFVSIFFLDSIFFFPIFMKFWNFHSKILCQISTFFFFKLNVMENKGFINERMYPTIRWIRCQRGCIRLEIYRLSIERNDFQFLTFFCFLFHSFVFFLPYWRWMGEQNPRLLNLNQDHPSTFWSFLVKFL